MASKVSPNAAETPQGSANPLRLAEAQGQGIWLDYIRRTLLTSGALRKLVDEDGLSGMTSNPTIFEKAIAGSADYDDTLKKLIDRDSSVSAASLFEALAVEDIRRWPGVTNATRAQQWLEIESNVAEPVVQRLLATDASLTELEVRRTGLAEAFVRITREAASKCTCP